MTLGTIQPNIVYVLADDLGYGDVSCLNRAGRIHTPHLDRFAQEGMVFTDAHASSSVCSPSRYSLLTARYNWRSRRQSGIGGVYGDPLTAAQRLTVPALLKHHGYHTACIGKRTRKRNTTFRPNGPTWSRRWSANSGKSWPTAAARPAPANPTTCRSISGSCTPCPP